MASYDKLPSGLWRATVVTPIKDASGRRKRITKTAQLKVTVEDWAKAQEGAIAAGTWVEQRAAEMTLAEYRQRWRASKLDGTTAPNLDKVDSLWRTHLEHEWGGYPLPLITRAGLRAWVKRIAEQQCSKCRAFPGVEEDDDGRVLVAHLRQTRTMRTEAGNRMWVGNRAKDVESFTSPCPGSGERAGLGPWTVQAIVGHLSGLLGSAVADGLLLASPAVRLELPSVAPKPVFFWTRDEAALILLELGGPEALLVESGLYMGPRPGELFGLRRRYVDLRTWQVHVYGVATRKGWKPWPKTKKSNRPVPIPRHLRERWAQQLEGLAPDDLVFTTAEGRMWDDREFAQQVFAPAVERAGVPVGTPYDMRHTAASWLVQMGVPLQRVQELLGHEKYATTLRYAHLAPKAFDEVLDAWGEAPLDPRDAAPRGSPSSSQPHEGG